MAAVGVRKKTGELVGFMLEYEDGSAGMLYVHPDHRGKGIGSVLIRKMAEEILKNREEVFVDIERHNSYSVRLHERCGYRADPSASLTYLYVTYSDCGD